MTNTRTPTDIQATTMPRDPPTCGPQIVAAANTPSQGPGLALKAPPVMTQVGDEFLNVHKRKNMEELEDELNAEGGGG